jgi:hypothetical protein
MTPMPTTTSAPTMPTTMPTQLGTDSGAATLTTAALLPLAVGWGVALFI